MFRCFQSRNSTSLRWVVLAVTVVAHWFATQLDVGNVGSDEHEITLSDPIESVWEFGLKINAVGNTTGITATVPVPMEWPEQQLEILAEEKSDNVGKFSIKQATDHTRQLSFKIRKLAAGHSETAIIRFRIKKRLIVAPMATQSLVVPKRMPSEIKTFLKPSPYIESNHKQIREIAESLWDESLTAWDQVEKNFRWVRDNIEYKFDKQIHSCLEALEVKRGDCEELSSLFIAICRSQGIPARAVWIPDHTYPEFYLHDQDGVGHWYPCQAAGNYEFGAMTESKPILQKGDRFRIDAERKEVRYLRPSLVARQSNGGVSIEWIARQVTPATANDD